MSADDDDAVGGEQLLRAIEERSLRRLVEIGEREVATAQRVNGRGGRPNADVGVNERETLADSILHDEDVAAKLECFFAQRLRKLGEAARFVRAATGALEDFFVRVGTPDGERS